MTGDRRQRRSSAASRWLGVLVVLFSFGLGGAELLGFDLDRIALPTGLLLFATVITIRVCGTVLTVENVRGASSRQLNRAGKNQESEGAQSCLTNPGIYRLRCRSCVRSHRAVATLSLRIRSQAAHFGCQ